MDYLNAQIEHEYQRLLSSTLRWLTGLALAADNKGHVEINVNANELNADIWQIQQFITLAHQDIPMPREAT